MFSYKLSFLEQLHDNDYLFEQQSLPTSPASIKQRKKEFSSQKSVKAQTEDLFAKRAQERRRLAVESFLLNQQNDLYHIMEINQTASKKEIRSQFKKLSLLHHPDKQLQKQVQNHDVKDRDFSKITEAYKILQDDNLRKIYDNEGYLAVQRQMREKEYGNDE